METEAADQGAQADEIALRLTCTLAELTQALTAGQGAYLWIVEQRLLQETQALLLLARPYLLNLHGAGRPRQVRPAGLLLGKKLAKQGAVKPSAKVESGEPLPGGETGETRPAGEVLRLVVRTRRRFRLGPKVTARAVNRLRGAAPGRAG